MNFTSVQKKILIVFGMALVCFIAITGILTNIAFKSSLPPQPSLITGNGRTSDMVKQDIENYKNMVTVIKEREGYFYDLLIVKFAKGLFDSLLVAIIAFVFGKPMIEALADRIRFNKVSQKEK